jgi:putative multiple sugar transport system permease protein
MVGGLVMGVLNLGLANMSVDSNFVQIIKGLVLLGAVAFDVYSKSQGRPSFIGMILKGLQRGNDDGRPGGGGSPGASAPVTEEVQDSDGFRNASRSHVASLEQAVSPD